MIQILRLNAGVPLRGPTPGRQKVPPTSGAPIRQGLCILAPDGTVLEWSQIFRDESAVLDFLDRTLATFR